MSVSLSASLSVDPPELVAFEEQQVRRGLAPLTISARGRAVRRLAAWLAPRSLSQAGVADLRAFVASRRARLAAASQVTEINYLQAFYRALLELGRIDVDPSLGLRSWRTTSPRRPLGLRAVQALLAEAGREGGEPAGGNVPAALRAALTLRDRACLELLFATGVRASELCAARTLDLDLEPGAFFVRRAKRGASRRLPLPAPSVAALRRYLEEARPALRGEREDPGALFLTRAGRPLTHASLTHLVKRASARADVPAYPHVFRRTLATEFARAGVALPVIQKVLGHAHLSTTGDYVEVSLDDMREALDELDRGLPRCHTADAVFDNLQCRLFAGWEVAAA